MVVVVVVVVLVVAVVVVVVVGGGGGEGLHMPQKVKGVNSFSYSAKKLGEADHCHHCLSKKVAENHPPSLHVKTIKGGFTWAP